MKDKKDNPGVIAPPPLIFFSGLLIGGLVSWFYPSQFLPMGWGRILGIGLSVFGLAVIFIAWLQMRQAKTSIEPWHPTTAILSSGVFSISRNPIYVAMVLGYVGVVLLFDLLWALPTLVLVLVVMHYGVILREENYLEQKFGEEYLSYKGKVRRWI